ncbi:MAG: DUF4911 domain-containing protein [Desulfamplus sp.]|nr:DUF4911 domain-containing protein [Desulfamplus sp.]MBF0412808.1 DUF4911 domain-containing protein [Desulfamplus sp.]
MRTIHKLFRVDKSRIGFLKFIFEAHDGLAVITTLDAKEGVVRFAIAPGCMEDVEAVLADLKKDIYINEL